MALPRPVAAINRIRDANGNAYDPSANPGGLAEGGHRQNFVPDLNAVADIGDWAASLAVDTAADAVKTGEDRTQTGQDRTQTGQDRAAAAQSASDAAAQVTLASQQAQRLMGTSATSVTPGTGSRSFTTQGNKQFLVGTFVQINSRAAPTTRWLFGQVTSYNTSTGALVVDVQAIGTLTSAAADWDIYVAGARGAQGIQGTPGIATMPYRARSSNTQILAADSAALFDATGTFTQTFAAPATLGANWYCFYKNAGTGNITIPASDGRTNWIMYPGEMRLFQCDGTTLRSEVLNPFYATFTASGTFVLPPGYVAFEGLLWSGGGGGGSNGAGGGGSGGGCAPIYVRPTELALSTSFTIGGGGALGGSGALGGNGGDSSFGPLTITGGGGGASSASGSGQQGGGVAGMPNGGAFGGAPGGSGAVANGHGGGSGSTTTPGGTAIFGGAGGSRTALGGTSIYGGNGGTGNNPGTAPGGGGGAGGVGARGELRLWGVA